MNTTQSTATTEPTPAWSGPAPVPTSTSAPVAPVVDAAQPQEVAAPVEEITPQREFRIVQRYLNALQAASERKNVSPEKLTAKLEQVNERLSAKGIDPIARLADVQLRIDLRDKLRNALTTDDNMPELEAEFVQVAVSYSQRKGLTYGAWREIGVPATVLRAAGVR